MVWQLACALVRTWPLENWLALRSVWQSAWAKEKAKRWQ